jgi:hypothetical protein
MSDCTFPGVPKYTAKSAAPLVKYEEKKTEPLFSILVWPLAEKMVDEKTPAFTPGEIVEVPLESKEINSGTMAPGFTL